MVALRALLYSWSSFFRRESASLRLALFMIVAMALMHRAGMSSRLGGSGSCRNLPACVRVCLVCWESVVVGVLVFGLGSMFLAVFLSGVMCFSCLVSDLAMDGCSFMFVSLVGGWAIGHIVWAKCWYPSTISTTSFAAMSIWPVVIWSVSVRCWMVRRTSC